ncbi:hypothetical protein [Pantanalinema sp. GBBB05]|uniref:hypothetical protein n=1 Tax=Pantanalinema sp. GBBB05 TaxID=2604139 RepID=UPI001DDFE38F|nr:hypothetical protein [Pantanalinema sp. GBBB05]
MKSNLNRPEINQPGNSELPRYEVRSPNDLDPAIANVAATIQHPGRSLKLPQWIKARGWLFLGLTSCLVFGGVGAWALVWLATPPPSADCQNISVLSPDMERLYCAQEAARSGDLPQLLAGLKFLEEWTPEHPLYKEAQKSIDEWSAAILRIAQQRIEQSDLKGAVDLAKQIPKSSPIYQDAQAIVTQWQTLWQRGEAISTKARNAMKQQRWDEASQYIASLREINHDYWRYQRPQLLSRQLLAEQQARRLFADAQSLASLGAPTDLGAAIAAASKIEPTTFTWAEARRTVKQWSETLLALGVQHWRQNQTEAAIAAIQPVTLNPDLAQAAYDLIGLSYARQFAVTSKSSLMPSFNQLGSLTTAVTLASMIPTESRYYPLAQASIQNWQTQLQDSTQLQLANVIAQTGQTLSYDLAIAQAQQITPDRPQRLQAQTLIAMWRTAQQQLEDRPYLLYAQQLAEPGTLVALKAAIAQANQIAAGRALRGTAQSLVRGWYQAIQTIEDQPILDRAWSLAGQGDLNGAIQVAANIAPRRSLYWQAQGAIGDWQAQLRAAQATQARQSTVTKSEPSSVPQQTDQNFPSSDPSPTSNTTVNEEGTASVTTPPTAEEFPQPGEPSHSNTEPPPPPASISAPAEQFVRPGNLHSQPVVIPEPPPAMPPAPSHAQPVVIPDSPSAP